MTANELTKYAINALNQIPGVVVWRNNNLAVKGRKFVGRKGVSDIIGHDRDCKWIAIEIKAGKDILSEQQLDFITEINNCGGYAVVARNRQDIEQIFHILNKRYE